MPKKKTQLELFAALAKEGVQPELIHSLGLLGWKDPLWTRKFTVKLLDGSELVLTPATVRQLHEIARQSSAPGAEK